MATVDRILEEDLDWREAELASLKAEVAIAGSTGHCYVRCGRCCMLIMKDSPYLLGPHIWKKWAK
jgi:hypothetical protein